MGAFSTFGHAGDMGLSVRAPGRRELFAEALAGLMGLMVTGPREGEATWLPLSLSGRDLAELLVQTLNEAVYLLDGEGLIAVALEIAELGPTRLVGRLRAVPLDPGRHTLGDAVKAVTYHGASVVQTPAGWEARLVADM